jgi:membrane-associated phospholipid phosphatase
MNRPDPNQAVTRDSASRGVSTLPVLIFAGLLYMILALIIRRRPSPATDLAITKHLQSNDHPYLERGMAFVSWFGFRPQSLILPLGTILGFWWWGRRLEALLLFVAWGSSMMSFLTKQVIRRPRPDHPEIRVAVARIRDTSFPSGHVVHYVTFWGFVAYLLAFRTPVKGARWLAGAIMVPIITLVGPSRVYLGHHWFTDVVGSYLLGTAYVAGLIELSKLARPEDQCDDDGSDESGWRAGARQWLR